MGETLVPARINVSCVNRLTYILFRDYICWSNFRCRLGIPVFNELVCIDPLNSGLRNLASRN